MPRFDYERHLAAMTGPDPHWPEGTRHVSQLRLSLRVQPRGLIAGLRGAQVLHLDIVDYPGEWLLDLRLMDRDFAGWSTEVLGRDDGRPGAQGFADALAATPATGSTTARRKDWPRPIPSTCTRRARRVGRTAPPAAS